MFIHSPNKVLFKNIYKITPQLISRGLKIKSAIIQNATTRNLEKNLEIASELIDQSAANGAKLVVLQEMFNTAFGLIHFKRNAESVPDGTTSQFLSRKAAQHSIHLVGGSYIEKSANSGELYNTCTVWGPSGQHLATYRKIHSFDVNVPGLVTCYESKMLGSGDELATFELADGVKVGLGICYDIRFEELAKAYRKRDCKMIIYPAGFNKAFGPLHWELLLRARAVDNQVYVFGVSMPFKAESEYHSYAHSLVVDPWGKILGKAGVEQEIVYSDLDFDVVDKLREGIPIFNQRRTEIYDTIETK